MKKRIAAALVGGGLIAGGLSVADKITGCDFEIEFKGEQVCIDEQIKEILEAELPVSKGFGGIKFNQQ